MINYQNILKSITNKNKVIILFITIFFSCNLYGFNYKEIVLKNGLKVCLIQMQVPLVAYAVTYSVGTLEDNFYDEGMSLILERSNLLGTNKYSPEKISDILTNISANYNSYIGPNHTVFSYMVPLEYLDDVIDIERDKMQWLKFIPQKIENIKTSIVKDFAQTKNDPLNVFVDAYKSRAYPYTAQGRDYLLDTDKFAMISARSLKKFYQTWYVPNNANIVVIGNIDIDEIAELIKNKYESIYPNNQLSDYIHSYIEPDYNVDVKVDYKSPLLKEKFFVQSYLVPSWVSANKKLDVYALDIIAEYLSSKSGYFYNALTKDKLVSNLKIRYNKYKKGNTAFHITMSMGNKFDNVISIVKKVDTELKNIKKFAISQEDRDASINAIIDKYELSKENIHDFALQISMKLSIGMEIDEIMHPRKYYAEVTESKLNQVYSDLIASHTIMGFADNSES